MGFKPPTLDDHCLIAHAIKAVDNTLELLNVKKVHPPPPTSARSERPFWQQNYLRARVCQGRASPCRKLAFWPFYAYLWRCVCLARLRGNAEG
jgi:hypothetical protein